MLAATDLGGQDFHGKKLKFAAASPRRLEPFRLSVSDAADEQKDLRFYLRPLLRRWWLFLTIIPLVTAGTYVYYAHKPKTYESSAQLYFQPSTLEQLLFGRRPEATKIEDSALLIQTHAVAERAQQILEKEAKKSGGKVPAGGVSSEALEKSSFIIVTGAAANPQAAAQLANANAKAFAVLQKEQVLHEAEKGVESTRRQLKQLPREKETTGRREGLEKQLEELQLVAAQPGAGGVRVVETAAPDPHPVGHDPTGNAIFAFFVSLMLAIGAAYGLEYLNRRITRVEDVEEIYQVPVLSEIPQVHAPAPKAAHGVTMDRMLHGPFQRLQTNLEMQARERPLRTIVVASAAPGEGKSIVARNLALAYREAGRNVAVLDADLRKATMGGLLDAREGLGLGDILAGRASFGEVVQEIPVELALNGKANGNGSGPSVAFAQRAVGGSGELAMIPAGERNESMASALSSQGMRDVLAVAADTYGTAIIDSPPLLAVADALPLLSEADAVVLVMRLGVTTRDSARRLLRELRRVPNVFVAGIVVNGIPPRVFRSRSYGYYYG
jgi:Mrp family chromosome partitioning ATPase/capsular polysaccharide biosynthesis protein